VQLAGCIITNSDGDILLIHRNSSKRTQWEIPGGKLEDGETPEQAAVRELKEELDITVTVNRTIGSQEFEQEGNQYRYYWFKATVTQGKPRLTGSDDAIHDSFRYCSLAEMRTMFDELSANAQNFVRVLDNKQIHL